MANLQNGSKYKVPSQMFNYWFLNTPLDLIQLNITLLKRCRKRSFLLNIEQIRRRLRIYSHLLHFLRSGKIFLIHAQNQQKKQKNRGKWSNLTKKASLLLTLDIFHFFFITSTFDFEEVNFCLESRWLHGYMVKRVLNTASS